MQAARWKQIEELFQAAMAQPPAKRAEFLRRACPEDAELRGEVESLLNQNADTFLESSPLPPLLVPGAKLGSFELIACIGRGGMGEVWRAHDPRLKRDVAIKILPSAFASDPDRIARFEREARAASALSHPNIVSIFDIGHEGGKYWIVSELVDGESLLALISRGALPPRKAAEIAMQIAGGLAAAHGGGVSYIAT
jgi:serine/threonine protein kinase